MLRSRPARSASPARLLVSAALVAGALAGCDQVQESTGPDPEEAAEALAEGLAEGDLSLEELSAAAGADPDAAYDALTEGLAPALDGRRPTVSVAGVERDGDRATATLAWSWPLGTTSWEYDTEVPLELVDDRWRATWSPELVAPGLGEGEELQVSTIRPDRGDVVGARGKVLVTERPVVRFGIDRSAVPEAVAVRSARRLAALAGVDAAPYADQVRRAGPQAFVEAITYRADAVPATLAQGYEAVPGALAVPDELPLGPTRGFAEPILGTVGEVTAEMIEEDPDVYSVGDEAGLSGLQARYDEQLRGEPGLVVAAVRDDPSGGDDERELFRSEAQPGDDLRLTLDPDLQVAAERVLAGTGPASALVALRPSTGAVVAAANGPGTGGLNLATYGRFAPGSTFKVVTSLALLRAGLTPTSTVSCTPTTVVDGKSFKNYSDYPPSALGRVSLRTAVAHSCNTALISQRDRLGDDGLVDAAASLGLGIDHDLGFPAYLGSVEPAGTETEAAANLIGQGRVLASPMVMAAVIGSVQAGELVVPRLVEPVQVAPPDGAAPLAPAEVRSLREMLRAVVTEGSGRSLADVPGPPVIAKTGTAEFGTGPVRTHAWMVAAQGDLAVAAFVEVGGSGSTTAGPLVEAFLRAAR